MGWGHYLRSAATEPPGADSAPAASAVHSPFSLNVVFTTWQGTLAALNVADRQSRSLGLRVVLWYFQTVPSHFTPSCPPVSTEFLKQRLLAMARTCRRTEDVEIRICFCTNEQSCMQALLPPESVVIAGGRKRWWLSREQRTAAFLRSHGCRVLFIADRPGKRVAPAGMIS
jgi:hypothetical protein